MEIEYVLSTELIMTVTLPFLRYLPQVSVDLTPQSFTEKVLNGKDHWVIDFYAPWCGPCQNFAPEFEILARVGFYLY